MVKLNCPQTINYPPRKGLYLHISYIQLFLQIFLPIVKTNLTLINMSSLNFSKIPSTLVSFCFAGRKTQNKKTLLADLLLAGIADLITVIVADKLHKHPYIHSLKPLNI